MNKIIRKYFNTVFLICLCSLAAYACVNRFVQDDAFISLRYSFNLANGNGLVWNTGEYVEGYTNFLWTVILTLPFIIGFNPISFIYVTGIGLYVVSLFLTYKTAYKIIGSKEYGLLCMIIAGLNFSFSSYATGGLETSLQTLLFTSIVYVVISMISDKKLKINRLLLLSILYTLSLLTRLDSAIIITVSFVFVLFMIFSQNNSKVRKISQISIVLLLPVLIIGTWLLWKLSYYGNILPNTYYLKAGMATYPLRGAYYVLFFLFVYFLLPGVYFIYKDLRNGNHTNKILISYLVSNTLIWLLYVIYVGGDFMEFRLIIPIIPSIIIMIVKAVTNYLASKKAAVIYFILIIISSFIFSFFRDIPGMMSIKELNLDDENNFHSGIVEAGKKLGEYFNYDSNVIISTAAAGAIPYYSRLRSVDMLGLCDSYVAHHGEQIKSKVPVLGRFLGTPGHTRKASIDYLMSREVNLVLGSPYMKRFDSSRDKYYTLESLRYNKETALNLYIPGLSSLPNGTKVLEIPINEEYFLVTLYLTPTPNIDSIVKEKGWPILDIKNK